MKLSARNQIKGTIIALQKGQTTRMSGSMSATA